MSASISHSNSQIFAQQLALQTRADRVKQDASRAAVRQNLQQQIHQLTAGSGVGAPAATPAVARTQPAGQHLSAGANSASTMHDANTISSMGAGTAQSLVQQPSQTSSSTAAPSQPAAASPVAPKPAGPAYGGIKLSPDFLAGLGS